jgi:RNA polymerase sigma-70 factor, ECF subfamily
MIDRQRLHDDAYRWEVVAGLIQDYGAAIMPYCLTWVDEGLSEEITQEVFVTAWEMLPKYRPEALLKAWLYGIARKKCMQAYRNRARRWVIAQTFVEEIHKRAHGEGQPSLGDCESQTTLCDRLSDSLARLSDVDRMLLNLRYWKELPVVEIAEIMGKSEGAVRRQLSRAQQRLKELMHETLGT